MDRALKVFAVATFLGLLAGIGTAHVNYGLGTLVIVLLGLGGYEFLRER